MICTQIQFGNFPKKKNRIGQFKNYNVAKKIIAKSSVVQAPFLFIELWNKTLNGVQFAARLILLSYIFMILCLTQCSCTYSSPIPYSRQLDFFFIFFNQNKQYCTFVWVSMDENGQNDFWLLNLRWKWVFICVFGLSGSMTLLMFKNWFFFITDGQS